MELKRESLGSLAGGIIKDSQTLLSQEVELLTAEVTDVWTEAKQDLVFLFWRGLAVLSATLLASLAVAQLLNTYTDLPLWICYGVVALAFLMFAGALASMRKMRNGNRKFATVREVNNA